MRQKVPIGLEGNENGGNEDESLGALPKGITYYVDAADPTSVKETNKDLKQFLVEKEKGLC